MSRYKIQHGVDFEWLENSWSYNLFRLWESVFGREEGIKPESAASIDGEGNVVRQFFSVESVLSFVENVVRKKFEFRPVRIWIPMLSTPTGIPMPASPYLFAIAFDASGASTAGVDSGKTLSFTASGSDNLILTHCAAVAISTSGCTWNGSAFTRVNSVQTSPGAGKVDTFAFVGASGTQNIVSAASGYNAFVATSYSGVNQSTTPDSSNGDNGAGTTAATHTIATTVVASNCWTFLSLYSDNAAPTAGTGSFLCLVGANIFITAFDSNGTVATGSVSMDTAYSPNTSIAQIICSFAPTAAAGPANLKSFDGNVKANIKSLFGNVIANVKSISGNS